MSEVNFAEAWAELERTTETHTKPRHAYKHYRPLTDAANLIVAEAQDDHRIFLGIPEFDQEMRGIGRGHLCNIVGFCMTPDHEVLTDNGWKNLDTIKRSDRLWTVNPETQQGEWGDCLDIHVFDHDGPLNRLHNKNIDAFVTDNHKWAVRSQYADRLKVKTTTDLNTSDYIPCAIDGAEHAVETHTDPYLRILAWVFTEGTYQGNSITVYQSPSVNPEKCDMIEKDLAELGWDHSIYTRTRDNGCVENAYRIKAAHGKHIVAAFPNKMATTRLVDEMSVRQRRMFIDTLILGDGYIANLNGTRRYVTTRDDEASVTAHLFAAAGIAFSHRWRSWTTNFGQADMHIFTERKSENVRYARLTHTRENYKGKVWCPETINGIILARRDGKVFYTHNSHSGKTLVLLKILENNPTKRIAYFAPDETQALVLTKVTSITHGVGARELESQVAKGDRAAIDLLRSTATEKYPNLAVFDGTLTPRTMSEGLAEAEEVWGEKVDLIIIDYVDLFEHGESVPQKFNWLKAFGIDHYVPMIAIHQASRSSGSNGKEMDIDSGGYGGEQQATFLIGVRRKEAELRAKLQNERQKAAPDADKITLLLRELDIAQHTLTANLVKNKRPGGRRVGEIDFEIEAGTGHLRQLDDGELPRQWLASRPDIAAPTVATPVWQEQEIEYEEPF